MAASQNSPDLDLTHFDMAGGSIKDAAGNNADMMILPDRSLAYDRNIVIDTDAPRILSVTTTEGAGYYGTGEPIDITVNFSEPVNVTGGTGMYLTLNSTAVPVNIPPFTNNTTGSVTYTVAAGDNTRPAYLTVSNLYVTSSTIKGRRREPDDRFHDPHEHRR